MEKFYRQYRKRIMGHTAVWCVSKLLFLMVTLNATDENLIQRMHFPAWLFLGSTTLIGIFDGFVFAWIDAFLDKRFKNVSLAATILIRAVTNIGIAILLTLVFVPLFSNWEPTHGIAIYSGALFFTRFGAAMACILFTTAGIQIVKRMLESASYLRNDWNGAHPLVANRQKSSMVNALSGLTRKALVVFFLLSSVTAFSQFKERHSAVRISEDNDWFTGTDRYYTNGIRIDFIFEARGNSVVDRFLLKANQFDSRVRGVGIVQTMYTPCDISKQDLIPNDRPYAGVLYLNNFMETYNSIKKVKVYSEFNLGVVGPNSYAKETQTWFHKLIHDDLPKGWNHQVDSEIIINYGGRIEKGLYSHANAEFIGTAGFDFGTTMTDINTGAVIRIGILDNYFASRFKQTNKLKAYLFYKPGIQLVIENKTLQGRLEGSQYAIDPKNMNHWIWRSEYGVALSKRWFTLSYSHVTLSQEFAQADLHSYGNVTMVFNLF